MDKIYVIMDNWDDEHGNIHSTLLTEEGAFRTKQLALKTLLEYLDINEPLEKFKRVVNENVVMEVYGDKVNTVYHIMSTRIDNKARSIYSINELRLQ